MNVIQQAQIGKLGIDLKRRTDEPTYPHGTLHSTTEGTARFSPINLNPNMIVESFVIPGTANASVAGPITLDDGVSVTVSDGATFIVI